MMISPSEIPASAIYENLYRTNEAAYVLFSEDPRDRAHGSACDNADDTSFERGFGYHSDEWFECYAASFEFLMDTWPR